MDQLPEEILVDILDYLDPEELISIQKTCSNLSKKARANPVWRYKCFEKSPSASIRQANSILNTLTNALQGLTLSERPPHQQSSAAGRGDLDRVIESARARAVNQWDQSGQYEIVDWYSEYKSRYAPLSADWLPVVAAGHNEIRGISPLHGSDKFVGYLDNASVCIWDLTRASSGRRQFRELGRSEPSTLYSDPLQSADNLFVDGMSTSHSHQKAYVAVGMALQEVDLNVLKVVSQSHYPFRITALSQPGPLDLPMTVGTQWSLHVHDPRNPVMYSPQSSQERIDEVPARPGKLTAMLPDISGDSSLLPSIFGISSPFSANPSPSTQLSSSPSWRPSHRLQNPQWMGYAKVEPGPLSILHHAENELLICGRFPSILSYDRRYFPRLQYVIHSSASLSAMTSIPQPPSGISTSSAATSTLIACGEYRGRGSLELYSLPHTKPGRLPVSDTTNPSPSEDDDLNTTRGHNSASESLFSYKNRQDAAKSKLLSVAVHGTKIVYSDSEGGLKWVERDGQSLVRRWNINGYQMGNANSIATSASVTGDLVARKIIPLVEPDSERGAKGDADLLIWTGEKIGIVTTNPQFVDHEEMVREMEEDAELKRAKEEQERKEEEYSKTMRQALERQADERRWMSRFRLKTRNW
jgi:hypothetical protein